MRYFCTYFDKNYLVKAVALIESLQKHNQSEKFTLFAVCFDEISRIILNDLQLQNVIAIPIHEIEQNDDALLAVKSNRSLVEYYWTLTPTIISKVLEKIPVNSILTYLDADLYFYSSIQPIYDELADNSCLIHEHRYSPELAYLEKESGKYNVGLLCFRNNNYGKEILIWWRERCLEWCYARFENGKMGDQMYLNDWTTRFQEVKVLENIGAGVAPWNHIQYCFSKNEDLVLVDNTPLIFYHFHSLAIVNPDLIIPTKHTTYLFSREFLKLCFAQYLEALTSAISKIQSIFPEFSFGISETNVLSEKHTFFLRTSAVSQLDNYKIPHRPLAINENWYCFCSDQAKLFSPPEAKIRVSAIVSTYNSERFMRGCLEDLVNQSLYQKGELEIVVVNSASEQDEARIVKEFQAKYPNIIYCKSESRETVYASWNRGIRLAKGEYLTNANTDDRHRIDAIEILADFLDNHGDVALVFADQLITTKENETFANTQAKHRWNWCEYSYQELEKRCLVGSQPVWRKNLHEKYGFFREEFRCAGDYDFWLRIGKHEKFDLVPDVLGLYFKNPTGIELGNDFARSETHQLWKEFGITDRGVKPAGSIPLKISQKELQEFQSRQISTFSNNEAVSYRIIENINSHYPIPYELNKTNLQVEIIEDYLRLSEISANSHDFSTALKIIENALNLSKNQAIHRKIRAKILRKKAQVQAKQGNKLLSFRTSAKALLMRLFNYPNK